MNAADEVHLEPAAPASEPLLANMLELYLHDLSQFFPITLGPDGRFGYQRLPEFFARPERNFPWLIMRGSSVVGFALVTRGSPVSEDPEVLDVAEFFVLRSQRRNGVGGRAARELWRRLEGQWTVRVSEGNHSALRFWPAVIRECAGAAFSETHRSGKPHDWRVFSFRSSARPA